jgi:glycosyltransferase involved in cell wall biosynthesis
MFMIDIVEQLTKFDDKYIMIFAGNGETEESVKKYAQAKGLTNKVMFLGGRSDISELMNSADIFLLPSKDEGFGITLIEAQSTGIRVLASSRVPKETAITDLIEYLPIDDVNIWIEKIRNIKNVTRNSRKDDVEIAGYSVDRQAIKYIELIERVCSQ